MNAQDERERLLMAVVDLCEHADRTGAPLAERARAQAALARIGGYPRHVIDIVVDSGRPDLLALACASVDIDRSVFPTVQRMVSELQGRRSGCGDLYAQETANAFRVEPSQAALLLNERAMRLKAAAT